MKSGFKLGLQREMSPGGNLKIHVLVQLIGKEDTQIYVGYRYISI